MQDLENIKKCLEHAERLSAKGFRRNRGGADFAILPSVTIAAPAGAGAMRLARGLGRLLNDREDGLPWTVAGADLLTKLNLDTDLAARLERAVRRLSIPPAPETAARILTALPSLKTRSHKISETLYHLAAVGHVIITGYGGNVITSGWGNVARVLLAGAPPADLPERSREWLRLDNEERQAYMKYNFGRDLADPSGYDLVLNTGTLSADEAQQIILRLMEVKENRRGKANPSGRGALRRNRRQFRPNANTGERMKKKPRAAGLFPFMEEERYARFHRIENRGRARARLFRSWLSSF